MYNCYPAPEKAATKLRSRSTRALITDFVLTGAVNDPYIPTVRGWIMDELESRNPEAFAAWLDSETDDDGLFAYFNC